LIADVTLLNWLDAETDTPAVGWKRSIAGVTLARIAFNSATFSRVA